MSSQNKAFSRFAIPSVIFCKRNGTLTTQMGTETGMRKGRAYAHHRK